MSRRITLARERPMTNSMICVTVISGLRRLLTCCLCRSNGVRMCLFTGALPDGDPEPLLREGEATMEEIEEGCSIGW